MRSHGRSGAAWNGGTSGSRTGGAGASCGRATGVRLRYRFTCSANTAGSHPSCGADNGRSRFNAEITEGLAQYTGTVLAADTTADAITSALDQLVEAETQDSFVRTFAYTSGPAYGLLLDALSPGWTRRVRSTDDLASLVMRALAVQPAADATASAARYGGPELRASEQRREQQRQERIAELRRRFVDGPVLLFPGTGSGSFDTRGAVVIPDVGTVYFGAYRSSGGWGSLEANNGVLVASDGGSRRLSAPVRHDNTTFAGDGWTFKAAQGWVVREGARRGDYEVVRQQP